MGFDLEWNTGIVSSNPSFLNFPQRLANSPDQWKALKWQLLCELRVACPGIIQTFDPDKQTVTVLLAITENLNDPSTLVPTPTKIPVLVDVPILLPRGGGFSLTLPLQQGDECLVIFGDNCFDAWWQSGGVQNQVDRRRHDLSDGFAVLAPWSQPRVLSDYSLDGVQLRSDDGTKIVEIQSGVINVQTTDDSDISVNASGTGKVIIESAVEVDLTAPTVKIAGSTAVQITGGNAMIDGKDFLAHTHTGVATGASNSGPVT